MFKYGELCEDVPNLKLYVWFIVVAIKLKFQLLSNIHDRLFFNSCLAGLITDRRKVPGKVPA